MKSVISFFTLLLLALSAAAQPVVTVSAEGEAELPADLIIFTIHVNAEGTNPQQAYDLHKQREQALVQLLKKHDIPEKAIRFEPISINRMQRGRGDQTVVQTRQSVNLKLPDFDVYEKIQIGLIENDFDQFRGQFSSTKLPEGREEALRRAIRNAREKAEIIAGEAGVTLGDIAGIEYGEGQVIPVMRHQADMMRAESGGLMEFDQTVMVRSHITVKFAIAVQ